TFDSEEKRWDFADPCSWDDVLERWRGRGPRNAEMVADLQESYHKLRSSRGR
ncbi:MAG: ring,2-phenylacetyl-CoA epoxidase subunit PaaA, partial [Chloroflexota bacterium]|nr:ring,2-phenylacetyl-CoA epoxidase subunit PaaA [Chloroflexota bacterium]